LIGSVVVEELAEAALANAAVATAVASDTTVMLRMRLMADPFRWSCGTAKSRTA
jgi:hypothetical protein